MKKLLAFVLTAVLTAAFACSVWGSELSLTVELETSAAIESISEEEKDGIIDLLEMLPESGVFELLDGTIIPDDPELAKGTVSENAGRKELAFEDGFIPEGEEAKTDRIPDEMKITQISKTPEYLEVSFYCVYTGTKISYIAQLKDKDDNGLSVYALYKIWQDQNEMFPLEAVSEVFEDSYEEVIEPLY